MNNVMAIAGVVIKELYRRKDFYVLFVMTFLIMVLLALVRFFDNADIVRFLKEIVLLLIWISTLVIAITTAARQIPAERESRTIFPLLAKPVSRWDLVAGKFAGCWLACCIALALFYALFGLLIASEEHAMPGAIFIQAAWMQAMFLAVVVALALLGSVVFTAQSSNATICFVVILGILLIGGHLDTVASKMTGVGAMTLYFLHFTIPHLEWFDIRTFLVQDLPAIGWVYVAEATVYAALYTGLLLGLTWAVFRRKTLTL